MKLGRVHVLHVDELVDAQESLNTIKDAFEIRRNELSGLRTFSSDSPRSGLHCLFSLGLFRQRRIWASQGCDDVAYGMVRMALVLVVKGNSIRFQFSSYGYESELNAGSDDEVGTYKPSEELPSTSILKYPTYQADLYLVHEDSSRDHRIGGGYRRR